ncbi:hypothetical protein QA649_08100 [Bradyrhizobium sp. CB1717]|uniref:hypothetical protein n=1 Tax=Bradyrhizobium sp. CB1717 TaxID=3039154 RepID=UPI0024B28332|nr:hypothetical protein [Bradyrhizobium sp. CB1717]WFU26158.1 hypothetical protein QA649_08100 [Bradyrhizobium sp. CB1717]
MVSAPLHAIGAKQIFSVGPSPDEVTSPGGHKYTRHDVHEWSPAQIFAEDDLYTIQWGRITNTEIERFFFGKLDNDGPKALDYFTGFKHPSADGPAYQTFLRYMSVQKLRTPKGIAYLESLGGSKHKNITLMMLQRTGAVWCGRRCGYLEFSQQVLRLLR